MNEPTSNPLTMPVKDGSGEIEGLPKMPAAFYAISILVLFFAVFITYALAMGRARLPRNPELEPSPKFFALDNKFIILEDPRLRVPHAITQSDGTVAPIAPELRRQDLKNKLRLVWTEDYWWPKAVSGLYRPLTTTTYLINYSFLNDASLPPTEQTAVTYLAINLFLHFVNSVLVFLVLALLVQRAWPAFLAALLWAVHPLCVETVVNIVGRADQLACMFAMLGFLCYYRLGRSPSTGGRILWMALCGLLLIVGISAKENTVAMIFMILLFDFVYRPTRRTPINIFDWLFAAGWILLFMGALTLIVFFSYAPKKGSMSLAELSEQTERAFAYAFQYAGKLGMIVAGLAALAALGTLIFWLLDRHFPFQKPKAGQDAAGESPALMTWAARALVIVTMTVSVLGIWPLLDKWFNKKCPPDAPPYWKWFLARVPMYLVLAVTVLFWLVGVRERLFAGMREPELPFVDNPLVKYWEDGLGEGSRSIASFVTNPVQQLLGKEVLVPSGELDEKGQPKMEPWSFSHALRHLIPAWLTASKVLIGNMMLMVAPVRLSPDYSFNQIPLVNFDPEYWNQMEVFGEKPWYLPIDPPDPAWQKQTVIQRVNGTWANWSAFFSVLLLLGLFSGAVAAYFRFRPVCFFILLLLVGMLPTSNLIFVMGSIQAERFLYIPTIAMCLLITLTVYGVIRKLVGLMANDARTQRMALIVAARALLMGLALAFLIRSMWATLVWESDVKLWEAAVTVCPNSFKTHKSLAYAWYECTIKNMNKLREEREWQGKRQREIDHIVDEARKAIWATRKSQIVYVHLGAYLRIKGDLLTQEIPPPNSPLYKPDLESSILARAYACYAESASVLESAKPLDKAFSERNWRYEKRRGKSDEEIAAIGNYEIYWNLGIAYLRMAAIRKMQLQKLIQANPPAKPDSPLTPQQLALRNEIAELLSRAVASLEYMRLLAPSNVDAHLNLGSAYTEASAMGSAGAMDKAAVHFLSGWIVARIFANDNRPDILRILKGIYSAIATDPDFTKQPVVMGTDGKEYPNFHSCPPVREHFRQALLDLYDQFLKARDRNTAAAIRDIGIKQCNFPPETFPPLPPPPKRANLPQIGPTAFMFFSSLALIVVFIGLGWFATDRLLPQHAATPLPAPEETEPKPTQE